MIYDEVVTLPFQLITRDLYLQYQRNNKEYEFFKQSIDKWGLETSAIQIGNEFNKLEDFILNRTFPPNSESIRKILLNIALYAIVTLLHLSDVNSENV